MYSRQFVIQKHTKSGSTHWDMMLQKEDVLQTWRLSKEPEQIQNTSAHAGKIFDHPLKFLTYEGLVNKGKGSVQIADAGTYKIITQTNDKIEIQLLGQILKGEFILTRITENGWRFGGKIIS